MKDSGDISVLSHPVFAGARMPPIRPMSWYGGSQNTNRLSGDVRSRRWM